MYIEKENVLTNFLGGGAGGVEHTYKHQTFHAKLKSNHLCTFSEYVSTI